MSKSAIFVTLIYFCFVSMISTQDSAVSSYLDIDDWIDYGDILVRTVRAPISTQTTYYCTFQFNAGQEGGGYSGIQDSPDNGQTFYYIFSLWDPSNNQKITAPFVGQGTKVESFGGEGTGLKSWNGELGWSVGQWYTLVLRRWDTAAKHTQYGWWVNDITGNKWTHLVTMDYPVPNVYFNGGVSSFLEDWTSTGQNVRRFELKDGFKRTKDLKWHPFIEHRHSINQGDIEPGARSYNFRDAYDAGISYGAVYYQSGGSTKNTCYDCGLSLNPGSQPKNPAISFLILKAKGNVIEWIVPNASTPQYSYKVKVNGVNVGNGVEPERRSVTLKTALKTNDTVEVVLEDILGRVASQKKQVA